mmetsp:Transcript_15266/g.54324  ORF Transcript_15266/g.54324 Transcript_15266/m.54324 type:complete len:395 (+) Transcript_15266:2237-3421(+)
MRSCVGATIGVWAPAFRAHLTTAVSASPKSAETQVDSSTSLAQTTAKLSARSPPRASFGASAPRLPRSQDALSKSSSPCANCGAAPATDASPSRSNEDAHSCLSTAASTTAARSGTERTSSTKSAGVWHRCAPTPKSTERPASTFVEDARRFRQARPRSAHQSDAHDVRSFAATPLRLSLPSSSVRPRMQVSSAKRSASESTTSTDRQQRSTRRARRCVAPGPFVTVSKLPTTTQQQTFAANSACSRDTAPARRPRPYTPKQSSRIKGVATDSGAAKAPPVAATKPRTFSMSSAFLRTDSTAAARPRHRTRDARHTAAIFEAGFCRSRSAARRSRSRRAFSATASRSFSGPLARSSHMAARRCGLHRGYTSAASKLARPTARRRKMPRTRAAIP